MLTVVTVYAAVVLAAAMAVGFAAHLISHERGDRASRQRPDGVHVNGRHVAATIPVAATASRPPAAITDDAPEHDDFWRVSDPWNVGLRYAPILRNGRA